MQTGLDKLTQLLSEMAQTESQKSLLDDAKRQIFPNPTNEQLPFTERESYHKYKKDYARLLSFNQDGKNLSKNYLHHKIFN